MKLKIFSLVISTFFIAASCVNNEHLIEDEAYRNSVNEKFQERKELFSKHGNDLFAILNTDISTAESEALKFLFAYMPLSDIADYDGRFFLDNASLALKAREQTDWGKIIPENIFLHFVLPVRVNNENLDSFRLACFDEIHERIAGLRNIEKAALEINHWCHEKVAYQPADIRTSAPMATVLSARGRCGEESTFTVAALRTAGIPARQIYTPRWAHSDDNHAWVEVWVDGEWKYLGACEPEPVLDRGWFTEPSRRAMLTHTLAFGLYRGDENIIKKKDKYAEINTLAKYARTKTILIKVLDAQKKAAVGAIVEPRLYNFAEFYPLAELESDDQGFCRFETGLGDLLIWASKDDNFAFEKISVEENDTLVLQLGSHEDIEDYYEFDMQPPVKHIPFPDTVPLHMKQENAERLKKEDSIRHAYMNTWMNDREAVDLALSMDMDTARVKSLIDKSMGNYSEIRTLMKKVPGKYRELMLELLEVVAEKDLRDTKAGILEDHILHTVDYYKGNEYPLPFFVDYILNPRISHEIITAWRSYILNYFDSAQTESFIADPAIIAGWLSSNIRQQDDMNHYRVPLSPEGVLRTGFADELSNKILFVACCRTLGIPARLEPGTNIPQFFRNEKWQDVSINEQKTKDIQRACLKLSFDGPPESAAEYYRHFTIARFEEGRYITLDYEYNRNVKDFDDCLSLPPGEYMLATGNRTGDSEVLSSLRFFNLEPGEKKTLHFELREEVKALELLGKIDLDQAFLFDDTAAELLEYADQGLLIVWIDHNREPSKHILNDLPLVKGELDELACQLVFLSDPSAQSASYKPGQFKGLPLKSLFAFDKDLAILNSVRGETASPVQLPFVIYSDPEGNIYYMSEGYRIGIGEQILKTLYKIN
ncbi:MAG: transglutaminase domain-containing protein [Bacteroidota bacterium]